MDFFFFDAGFQIFQIMFFVVFCLIVGMMAVMIIKSISQWNKDNHSPKLIVEAKVVAKRTHVSRHHGSNSHGMVSSTRYYVTFQVESGDRMELSVSGREYGMLAEGDMGKLTFQGSRYLGFERREFGI